MSKVKKGIFGEVTFTKDIGNYEIVLMKSWDMENGKGWFVWIYPNWNLKNPITSIGVGFHKKNKFTAVRNAIRDLGQRDGRFKEYKRYS